MKYNKDFKNLLSTLEDKDYVGLGNPNSKILFIGKEAGADENSEIIHGSAKDWNRNGSYLANPFIPNPDIEDERKLMNYGHTWQKYQSLYNQILQKLNITQEPLEKYEINFVKNVFTTELNSLHAPCTRKAKQNPNFKTELQKRKELFFDSDFIRGFQITVIFASDNKYIETYKGEVLDLFKVTFYCLHEYKGKGRIWINRGTTAENKQRIVIHTRQLAQSENILITELASIIAEFTNQNDINILDEK